MKTKNIDAVKRAFSALETEGFRRKGKRWTRRSSETVVVVDLQKERGAGEVQDGRPDWWGPKPLAYFSYYSVNFGVWPLSGGEPPEPLREELCPVRRRIGDDVEHALHLEYAMDPDERSQILNALVKQTVIPLADQCKTRSGCIAAISADRSSWIVDLRGPQLLGIPSG